MVDDLQAALKGFRAPSVMEGDLDRLEVQFDAQGVEVAGIAARHPVVQRPQGVVDPAGLELALGQVQIPGLPRERPGGRHVVESVGAPVDEFAELDGIPDERAGLRGEAAADGQLDHPLIGLVEILEAFPLSFIGLVAQQPEGHLGQGGDFAGVAVDEAQPGVFLAGLRQFLRGRLRAALEFLDQFPPPVGGVVLRGVVPPRRVARAEVLGELIFGLTGRRLAGAELVAEDLVEVGAVVASRFVAHDRCLMSRRPTSSSPRFSVNPSPYYVGRKECHRGPTGRGEDCVEARMDDCMEG